MARRRKGRKDAITALLFPIFAPSFPRKRESRLLVAAKPATQNQVQIPTSGSLLPLWAYRGRLALNSMGLSLRRRSAYRAVIPAKAGIQTIATKLATRNQVQIPTSGSLLPLWEKVRMRVTRASAALRATIRPFAIFGKRILIIDMHAQASYNLTNPKAGALNRTNAEGANYKLQDIIANLTNEFQERRR